MGVDDDEWHAFATLFCLTIKVLFSVAVAFDLFQVGEGALELGLLLKGLGFCVPLSSCEVLSVGA